MSNGWTLERRERQAQAIRTWKPWTQATGPQSDEGKMCVAQNAFKGGKRQRLREELRSLKAILESFTHPL